MEAKRRLEAGDVTFVDVRDSASYAAAHVPGALHVHDGNVGAFVGTHDKTKAVIVYCYHGISSRGGCAYFLSQGFAEVFSMSGGFEAWRGAFPGRP